MPDVTPDEAFCERLARNMDEQRDVLAALAKKGVVPDVTPDDDNDGVEVWRCAHDNFPTEFTNDSAMAREYGNQETGRWFTTLRAEQLLAIEKAARYVSLVYFDRDGNICGLDKLEDALRPAAPGTPE